MTETENEPGGERIAKVLARAGLCSRRDAERAIAAGRVTVDGKCLDTPAVKVTAKNKITFDGKPVTTAEDTGLWLYHKPTGLVTTHKDPEGRRTVFESLPKNLPRMISVGRLDINSEGLLLLTNDGELARAMELPATGWIRSYRVRVRGRVNPARLKELERGVTVEGVRYSSITAKLERQLTSNAWLTMDLKEGKNREVRRVVEHLGLEVNRLIRVSYGPFKLGKLFPGEVVPAPKKALSQQIEKLLGRAAPSYPENRPLKPRISGTIRANRRG